MSASTSQKKLLAAALISAYILLRYVFPSFLDQFGMYGSYAFEIVFCLNFVYIFYSQLRFRIHWNRRYIWSFANTFVAGFIVFSLAAPLQIAVPFNLDDAEMIFLLVLFGPVLEEFIFRFAFWETSQLVLPPKGTLFLTSLIFSYSHFHAFFIVPDDFKIFVVYQTLYTFLLGWWLGRSYLQTRAIFVPIALHIAFNLGFLLGFILK